MEKIALTGNSFYNIKNYFQDAKKIETLFKELTMIKGGRHGNRRPSNQ